MQPTKKSRGWKMAIKQDKVQVINTLTGEVYDFEWENIDQLRRSYQELDSIQKSFDRAIGKMKVALNNFLDKDDEYIFPDGAKIKRYYTTRKELRKDDVAKYLDADQLDLVLQVNSTAVKEIFAEMVDRGELPLDAYEDVENNAIIKSGASYIRIIK
jgi:hypothetical protein